MLWLGESKGDRDERAVHRRRAYLQRLQKEATANQVVHRMEDLPWFLEYAVAGRKTVIDSCAGPYADQVGLITEVGTSARNLDRLFELALVPGDDTRRRRQRLEALMTIDFALAMHFLEPRRARAENSLNAFVDELDHACFDGHEDTDLWSVHEPTEHMVVETGVGPPPAGLSPGFLHTRPVMRRLMRVGNRRVPVIFNPRNKDRFMAIMKMLRQFRDAGRAGARLEIHDMCGLSLVVPTEQEVNEVLMALEEHLFAAGATVHEPPSPYEAPASVSRNPHTAKRYRVAKQTVFIGDQPFEIQVQAQADYLSTVYASTQVNHDMYRVDQALKHHLRVLCPFSVYGVDWDLPEVADRIRHWKRSVLSAGLESVATKVAA